MNKSYRNNKKIIRKRLGEVSTKNISKLFRGGG